MKNFYCKVFVPSTEKYEYFKEINFLESKIISKFIQNNDLRGFSLFLQTLVNKNKYNKNLNFNILDYLLILCQLRGYSYGNMVTFNVKNDTGAPLTFKHNVQRLLGEESLLNKKFDKIIYSDKMEIKLNLPKNLNFFEENDIISQNIDFICIDSEKIVFENLSKLQKETILNTLPANFSNKIFNYIQEINQFLSNFLFFEPVNSKNFSNISLNPYNNSFIEYLKIIFSYDLMSLYELEYLLIRKLKFGLGDLKNISLNEAELHLNLYKKELKTIEEANSKSGVAKQGVPDN